MEAEDFFDGHDEIAHLKASISLLERRVGLAKHIRNLMTIRYLDVLETPDFQRIIENNTWILGPQYETIGAEDDTLAKIAKRAREQVLGRSPLDGDDVEELDDLDGARRQVDLFLARKFSTVDSLDRQVYKLIVIEIKRPAIALNRKHLSQLEAYADIIKSMPEFDSDDIHFEFILVGRQISSKDQRIRSRLMGKLVRGDFGLVEESPRMKLYVMNWASLFIRFERTSNLMLEELKLKQF